MENQDNIIVNNIFLLPTILCFTQFCFLFVALFNTGYFFEIKILLLSLFFSLLWGVFCVLSVIRHRNLTLTVQNIIVLILFILISLYIVRFSWFSGYLSVHAVADIFNGTKHIDSLYHAAIAESVITNGYPSIQQNAPVALFYHAFFHYIVAGLSMLLGIPCFITMNYVYPILIFPLFLFLLQRVLLIARKYFFSVKTTSFSFTDYVVLAGIICTFSTKKIMDTIGFYVYIYFQSETCMISLIFLLTYVCIIDYGYRNTRYFDSMHRFFIIPIFIIILSFAKISTGCMFVVGICYFLFRTDFTKKNIACILLYGVIFFIYYYIGGKVHASYPRPALFQGQRYELFHFVKNYTESHFFAVVHYIITFLPVFLMILFSTEKQTLFVLTKKTTRRNLFIELLLVTSVIGCLPGIFMKIDGGSAFYFYVPVLFSSLVSLLAMNTLHALIQRMSSNFTVHICRKGISFWNTALFTPILFFLIVLILFYEAQPQNIIRDVAYNRLSNEIKKNSSRSEKIKSIFNMSETVSDSDYIMYNEIRCKIKGKEKEFCIFISDDAELVEKYDAVLKDIQENTGQGISSHMKIKPYLATSAYIGVPIINSIYINGDYFFRGDGMQLGTYEEFSGYSMPPRICGEKITKENMHVVAKSLGKNNIILINKDFFTIISVH